MVGCALTSSRDFRQTLPGPLSNPLQTERATSNSAWMSFSLAGRRISGTSLKGGLVDADLGGGVVKQRITRAGEGRSGGVRAILPCRRGGRGFFAYGFAKSDQANLLRPGRCGQAARS